MTVTTVNLNAVSFDPLEATIATHAGLTASAFRYASGVAALRIRNAVGEIIMLPYHGQQIWDATFYGRRLTMRTMFEDPVNSRDYLANYGGFLLHCGATAMGNTGKGDTHPLHGELPNAPFQKAELRLGSDAGGPYMEITGSYQHTIAFSHNYRACPRIRMHENSGRLAMVLDVHNLKATPMDLMYLAHVNFRPVDDANLVDTVPDDPKHFRIRTTIPDFFKPTESHRSLIASLLEKPALHRHMLPGRAIDPELVMGLDFKTDAEGVAHSLQVLPDGSADFISHRPSELGRGVRWITRTGDQDALGLFLPATAEADGYLAEKAKGNVISLPAGETFTCHLEFGALTAAEAAGLAKVCKSAKS